jgi:hypothetical protein
MGIIEKARRGPIGEDLGLGLTKVWVRDRVCRVLFLCCAAPCSTERGPLNHFEICAYSNHETI